VNLRSARDEGGAVAILVAISLVVLCMAGAMAVDLGNVAQLHRHAQYTVDDAAISGADLLEQGTDTLTQIVSSTEGYIDENWRNLSSSAWDTCPNIPSGFSAPSGSLENCVTFNGTATATASAISVELPPQSVPFTLARLGGFMSGTVEALASAVIVPGTAPCALCVLGPTGLTLDDTGTGSFTVTDASGSGNAGIVVDSTATPAAYINGSGSITAPQIGVVGTYGVKHSGTFQPTPTTGVSPVPDPLGGLAPPAPGNGGAIPTQTYSCNSTCGTLPSGTYGNVSLGGNGTLTIPPGNYNTIGVTGSAVLTLEPGIYFIAGSFTVGGTGGASVYESEGVLLYFTCMSGSQLAACASGGQSGGTLSLSGTGSMTLEPQSTGPYANLTVFYDRNNDAGITLSGTPGLSITGTIYAKSASLALNGTGDTLASYIIVNSATISGNGSIGVNYDASQNLNPPGAPYLCSTTANNC
jgi:Putative Flp pilus-assembly TadE/G-like